MGSPDSRASIAVRHDTEFKEDELTQRFLKAILPYLKQVAGLLIVGSLGGLVMNTAVVLPALLLGRLIDTAVAWGEGQATSQGVLLAGVAYVGAAWTGMAKVSMGGSSLLALDAAGGKKLWKTGGLQGIAAPAIRDDTVICCSSAHSIRQKGKTLWSIKGGHQARTYNSATVANGRVYIMFTMRGAIDCVDPERGVSLWRVATNPVNLEMEMNSDRLQRKFINYMLTIFKPGDILK